LLRVVPPRRYLRNHQRSPRTRALDKWKREFPSTADAQTCATSSPASWMHCLVKAHPAFADLPLSYLVLPGSENAGTFNLDPQAFDTQTGSACTTLNEPTSVSGVTAQRFSATQDETITRQLDAGVRWVDLQVGYNGGGNPVTGWRVVQNLYSNWPLFEYLDEVANWAADHPQEAVVVDISSICYQHDPTTSVNEGLWANFATRSAEGAGPNTIASVDARASSEGSLASEALRKLARAGHNVAVILPASAKDVRYLSKTDHVDSFIARGPGGSGGGTVVFQSDLKVAPTEPSQFPTANSQLRSFPRRQIQPGTRPGRTSGECPMMSP
jgi:hypothetical protein